jgi:hypothetical protein
VATQTPLGTKTVVAARTVTDDEGRVWSVKPEVQRTPAYGRDVILLCTTPSLPEPVRVKLGWQWIKMAERGLARLIMAATR